MVQWIAIAALVVSLAAPASATTYHFSGTLVGGNAATQSTINGQLAIPNGTHFNGTLTIDASITTPAGGGDSQHRNFDFAGGTPPAEIYLHIGSGLYDVHVTSVGDEVDAGYTANFAVGAHDAIWFWSNGGQIVSGSGAAINPLFFDAFNGVLLWISTPDGPLATANTFSASHLTGLGSWEFAGLSLTVMQNGSNAEQYRGAFTSFVVPEPGSMGLALAAAGALWVAGRRRPR
jgi:hypothetical protein